MRFLKKPKLMVVVATVALMLIAVPVAFGGINWSGFDPQVQIDGTQYNVTVSAPANAWCAVEGVDVIFHVDPDLDETDVSVDFESTGGSGGCTVTTLSDFAFDSDDGVVVEVLVSTKGRAKFPVLVEVVVDEDEDDAATCRGRANRAVWCEADD